MVYQVSGYKIVKVGVTALLISVAQNNAECTLLLLKAGADPNFLCESKTKVFFVYYLFIFPSSPPYS